MFASTFISIALFASVIHGVVGEFIIDTPTSVKQCSAVKLTWNEEGKAPFNLVAVASADPCGEVLSDLGDHNDNSITWTPSLPAGSKIMLSLEDADGEEAWTGEITIGEGSDDCLSSSVKSKSSTATSTSASSKSTSTSVSSGGDNTDTNTPVGAAGADPLTSKSGASANQISMPILAISAIFAAVTLL